MRRLADTPELLDGPLDDPVALADNLRDLRRVNRHLGGIALSRRALRGPRRRSYRVGQPARRRDRRRGYPGGPRQPAAP